MKKITRDSQGRMTERVTTLLSESAKRNIKKFYVASNNVSYGRHYSLTEGVVTVSYIADLDMYGVDYSGWNFILGEEQSSQRLVGKEEAQVYLRKYNIDLNIEFPKKK